MSKFESLPPVEVDYYSFLSEHISVIRIVSVSSRLGKPLAPLPKVIHFALRPILKRKPELSKQSNTPVSVNQTSNQRKTIYQWQFHACCHQFVLARKSGLVVFGMKGLVKKKSVLCCVDEKVNQDYLESNILIKAELPLSSVRPSWHLLPS